MPESVVNTSSVIIFFFWGLTAITLLAQRKTSLFAYLLLVHIDVSGPSFRSAQSFGVENILKVIVIPTFLLWRMGAFSTYIHSPWPRTVKLWLLLISYATLAILWGPAPVAGVKMSGYLYSYIALFLVFLAAWAQGLIDAFFIEFNLWAVFLLGVLQTYVLGNEFGSLEELAPRFTTFSSPQALAPCFLVMFAILQDLRKDAKHARFSMMLAVIGIVLTGSRYVFVGLILFFFTRIILRAENGKIWLTVKRLAKGTTAAVALLIVVIRFAPGNRLNEFFESSLFGSDRYDQVSTVVWRLGIYDNAFDEMSHWSFRQFLMGAGTSSAGDLKAVFDPEFGGDILDANRSMHSEFLRAFYEWGVIGFGLLIAFLISLFLDLRGSIKPQRSTAKIAALSFVPTLLCGLAIENLLSNSGAPGGTAIVLILAYALLPNALTKRDRSYAFSRSSGSVALATGDASL